MPIDEADIRAGRDAHERKLVETLTKARAVGARVRRVSAYSRGMSLRASGRPSGGGAVIPRRSRRRPGRPL